MCVRRNAKDQTEPLELPAWKSHVDTADKSTQTAQQVPKSSIPAPAFRAVGASLCKSLENERQGAVGKRTNKQSKKAEDWEVVVPAAQSV